MRAFMLESLDSPPRLHGDLPEPTPADNEVLVRVQASSVNPADVAIAAGMLDGRVEHRFPVTLGRDFAGVVEQTGSDVTAYRAGDEVYGFVFDFDLVHTGTWAELIAVPDDNFVKQKPHTIDMPNAGVAPLAAITAIAAFDALEPAPGKTVLVIGATGGVGSFFVQLAATAGADVIAPAFPEDEEYLRDLGVSQVLDRNAELDTTADAILDLVSFSPRDSLLKEGGRLASPLGAAGEGEGRFNLVALPTPENLARLAELLDDGALRVEIQGHYELAQAGEAMQALSGSHTRGKLALSLG